MSITVLSTGARVVECSWCGAYGPHALTARAARDGARAAGWARLYPRGRGEDFKCPDCRRTVPHGTPPQD